LFDEAGPLSTSSGLAVIKGHHGAAAALYTFAFAFVSCLWGIVHVHLHMSTANFLGVALGVSTLLMLVLAVFIRWRR
jgi:hypothetical protein